MQQMQHLFSPLKRHPLRIEPRAGQSLRSLAHPR